MSALGGIVYFESDKPVDRATSERLSSVITPYGKDAQNSWERRGVLLMRSLMRTTPEDSLDRQPVVSPESGRVTVFDGRLDNREDLAAALELDTARLRLMADSALAASAIDAWSERAFDRLLGDFALGNWDPRARRLLLARDTVGYRPIFWHTGQDFFAFGSLPKALFAITGVPRSLREDALHDYLCLMPTEPQATMFESIYRLEPGQYLVLEGKKVKVERYHRFGHEKILRLKNPQEYVDGLAEQLEHSVSRRLRSIGPVASELSSGLDSSTITAIAARQLKVCGKRLLAVTGVLPATKREGPVPPGWHRDESKGAEALASMYDNIDHVLVESSGRSPLNGLEERIERTDAPVFNPSNMNWVEEMWAVARQRGAQVLLNGWQGNLTISHDGRSLLPALLGRGRIFAWLRLYRDMKRLHPRMSRRWFIGFSLAPFVPAALWAFRQKRKGAGRTLREYSAVSEAMHKQFDTERRARKRGHDLNYRAFSDAVRYRIAPLYRTEYAQTCLDLNAQGLDSRSPALDRKLLEYCLSVPEEIYLHGGQTRWLIRELGKQLLPPEILETRTRGYQGGDWFDSATAVRDDLRAELEKFRRHDSVGRYLDLDEMQSLLDNWPEQGWHRPSVEMRYKNKLLRGISVGAFVRYIENDNR